MEVVTNIKYNNETLSFSSRIEATKFLSGKIKCASCNMKITTCSLVCRLKKGYLDYDKPSYCKDCTQILPEVREKHVKSASREIVFEGITYPNILIAANELAGKLKCSVCNKEFSYNSVYVNLTRGKERKDMRCKECQFKYEGFEERMHEAHRKRSFAQVCETDFSRWLSRVPNKYNKAYLYYAKVKNDSDHYKIGVTVNLENRVYFSTFKGDHPYTDIFVLYESYPEDVATLEFYIKLRFCKMIYDSVEYIDQDQLETVKQYILNFNKASEEYWYNNEYIDKSIVELSQNAQ